MKRLSLFLLATACAVTPLCVQAQTAKPASAEPKAVPMRPVLPPKEKLGLDAAPLNDLIILRNAQTIPGFVSKGQTEKNMESGSVPFQPGQVYVLEFWGIACGPCMSMVPHLAKIQKEHAGKLTVIGINIWDTPEKVANFLPGKPEMDYVVAHPKFAKIGPYTASIQGIPHAYIIDQFGKIYYEGHPAGMDAPLREALAGKTHAAPAEPLPTDGTYVPMKGLSAVDPTSGVLTDGQLNLPKDKPALLYFLSPEPGANAFFSVIADTLKQQYGDTFNLYLIAETQAIAEEARARIPGAIALYGNKKVFEDYPRRYRSSSPVTAFWVNTDGTLVYAGDPIGLRASTQALLGDPKNHVKAKTLVGLRPICNEAACTEAVKGEDDSYTFTPNTGRTVLLYFSPSSRGNFKNAFTYLQKFTAKNPDKCNVVGIAVGRDFKETKAAVDAMKLSTPVFFNPPKGLHNTLNYPISHFTGNHNPAAFVIENGKIIYAGDFSGVNNYIYRSLPVNPQTEQ